MGAYGDYKKRLVKELKKRIVAAGGDGVSVRGGRGTAWGWIDVWCSPGADGFTPQQRRAVESVVGGSAGGNCWVGKLEEVGRILGIPAPN
jgi:hypothetical protein